MHGLHSQAFELEISLARVAWDERDYPQCFFHLERAHGNTGRARVSAVKPMPVPDDLRSFLS